MQSATDAARCPHTDEQHWSTDFLSDCLVDGRRSRVLNAVHHYSRECLAAEADTSLPGTRVTRVLDRITLERGAYPEAITVDNGPEFAGRVLDAWAYERKVTLSVIHPGKPARNACIEGFNGRVRDKCLNENWFTGLGAARAIITAWRADYNTVRPHGALGGLTPSEFTRHIEAMVPVGLR